MRLVFWGLVVVAFCYAAYSGMIAAWSWIAVNNAVDEIISREGIEAVSIPDIRTRVLKATNDAGIPIRDKDVIVTREDRGVRVEVNWTVPVIVVKGESVLAVPLTVNRASTGASR
jgi:hypothetical protein